MNKSFIFLFSLLMIGLASASMSINATLDVHSITSDIYLDTSDMELDEQTIVYEGYAIDEGLFISEILKGLDFRFEVNDGNVKFTKINISTIYTTAIIGGILNGFDAGFDVEDLNANPELVNGWLTVAKTEGNGYAEKVGNYYKVQFDKGFGDLPVESLKLGSISYSNEFIGKLFSFDADFSNVELKDGTYEIPFSFGVDSNEQFIANFTIINFDEITKYIPENETILEIVSEIKGLELGTKIIIEEKNNTEFLELSNTTQLKVLNITASQNTSGDIYFRVNKSLVSNKDKVFLYVLESEWKKLNTTLLNESDSEYEYSAYTPHFSIFSIAEEKVLTEENKTDSDSGSSGGSGSSRKKKSNPVVSEEEIIPEEVNLEIEIGNEEESKPEITKTDENKDLGVLTALISFFTLNIILLVIFIIKLKKIKKNANKDKKNN